MVRQDTTYIHIYIKTLITVGVKNVYHLPFDIFKMDGINEVVIGFLINALVLLYLSFFGISSEYHLDSLMPVGRARQTGCCGVHFFVA